MTNCGICNNLIIGNYCSTCGQPLKLTRIDKHYISHEVFHLLHFEKGFFFTVKELFIRPGKSIRVFIEKNRSKHMKPVAFLILTSLLFTLVSQLFHADDILNQKNNLSFGKSSINDIMNWVKTHWGYVNILLAVFTALCLKLLFSKHNYNFFELMIVMCFVMGEAMLLLTFVTMFAGILGNQFYLILSSVISYGYTIWAIAQFFDGRKIRNYVKAFGAYFLGYILFYVAIIPVGLIADLIIKVFSNHH